MSKFTFRQLIEAAKQSGELREGDADYVHGLFMDSYDFATLTALQEETASLREDKARLDWIGAEEADVDRIDRVQTYWFEGVGLRDAIDSAMKE